MAQDTFFLLILYNLKNIGGGHMPPCPPPSAVPVETIGDAPKRPDTTTWKQALRTIEARIVQKLKNNETRPKFTGSYKKYLVSKKVAVLCSN